MSVIGELQLFDFHTILLSKLLDLCKTVERILQCMTHTIIQWGV
jgi:hypothetical protein